MSFKERIDLLKTLDFYVRTQTTGSPKEFAQKLGVSESTLYRLIDDAIQLGADIKYSSRRESYYYRVHGSISIGFEQFAPPPAGDKY